MRVTLSERVLAVGTILKKSGREGKDAVVDAFEVFGGVEVVIADDEGDAGLAEVLDVSFFQVLCGLELEVGDLEADGRCLGEDLQLGGDAAGELSTVGCASTGGDGGDGGVVAEKLLELLAARREGCRGSRAGTQGRGWCP